MLRIADIGALNRPVVFAHRGASRVARENTLEAFEMAISMGADAIECDLRRTADGVIVVHHNATIPLTQRRISRLSFAGMQDLASRRGIEIPTLKETLELCSGRTFLDLELKESGYEGDVVQLALRYFDPSQVLFTSFQDASLAAIKNFALRTNVGLILGFRRGMTPAHWRRIFARSRLKACGADIVLPHWQLVRFGFMRRMQHLGLPVIAWTVDSPKRAQRLIDQGVAGIVSNTPDALSSIL
jgi:glycerophosphoryl diester phosphodiesterase